MPEEMIILVDEKDNPVGFEEKIRAHENGGRLHRAFSIFIFNSRGEMLLQLRSRRKHHFGGLWTNACCSHPRKGETLDGAAHRKLKQEFGFDTKLTHLFPIIYRAEDKASGLTEHEYDHAFVGVYDGTPEPNAEEIDEYKWISPEELKRDVAERPEAYTAWFKIFLERILETRPL